MGVDTRLLVRTSVSAEDVMEALKALGKTNVEYKATFTPSYCNIIFDATTKGWDKRMIHFHYNSSEDFGVPMNLLSLRYNDESVEILKTLAQIFGGIFQETDYDNQWESCQVPGQGNIRWLIDQYFLHTNNAPDDCDSQIEGFVKFTKERP